MNITGHENIINYFAAINADKRLAHSYLFVGNEGIGKRKTAKYIIKLLNCESEDPGVCGVCHSCRMIEAQTHPDVYEVDAADSLKVDQMRELMRKVLVRKVEAKYKCFIIDSVDKMSSFVSDAFLKTLEEPPKNVIFFMITDKLFAVSQTIRSRAQKIWFALKEESAIELLTNQLNVQDPSLWYSLSEGSPGKAIKMIDAEYCLNRDNVLANLPNEFDVDSSERELLKRDCMVILKFLRDAIVLHSGLDELVTNKDKMPLLGEYIARVPQHDLVSAVKNMLNIIATLDSINVGLAKELVNNIV